MSIRLGEVMIAQGLLTEAQVEQVLNMQRSAHRPFGVLAEDLFGISEDEVERAWVQQYATLTRHVNPLDMRPDPDALRTIDRRQAWQFKVMPLKFDGDELMIATTTDHLVRALRFASRCITRPCFFVLSEAANLGEALEQWYPLAGMTASDIGRSFSAGVIEL